MLSTPKLALFLPLAALMGLLSCRTNLVDDRPLSADSSYFSVKQYAGDQIRMFYGSPFTLYRFSHLNGARDSSLVSFFDMDWSSILKTFYAADIATRKMIGKYDFSVYDDATTGNRGYSYTANDPDVFTRLLQINTDPSNNRINNIYIETARKDFWGSKSQKLLYIPLRIIQIQETEGSLLGKARNLRVEYKFMQDDRAEELAL